VVLYREPFMFEPETDKRTIFFGRSEQSQFEDWPKLYPYLSRRANDKRTESSLKRAMNTVVSAVALVVVFPLCVVIGIAIKLTSKGPVLFREQRIGHHGKPFVFLKFRSMYVGHDPRVHKEFVRRLITASAERNPQEVVKLTRDPRITPIGEFLRRTSLVDLPQFVNILNGDMSLVGPRPLRPSEVEAYELWHRGRSTPPGHPPSLGDLDATVYAPLRPKPAPRSGAIALPEPNDTEDTDPNGDKANARSVSVEPPKTITVQTPLHDNL
jgi:lipopolysaccharide/colanic/teichoic acid biosynthesis glycosyltransferase